MADMKMDENEKVPEELPIELQLDLLVDEELPEERRRALLKSLDKMPAKWRELSIRFLERQVERKSARQLIKSGLVASPNLVVEDSPVTYKFPKGGWMTPLRMMGIAAGFLVAIGAGFVIVHEMQPKEGTLEVLVSGSNMVKTNLPSSVVGTEIPVQVSVEDVRKDSESMAFFPPDGSEGPGSRRSIVIQADGVGNALIIPVKNFQVQ